MEDKERLILLGKHIKAMRKPTKLSQAQLAHIIGKDQQSIQRLEAGKINPSYLYLLQVAAGLNVTISELVDLR